MPHPRIIRACSSEEAMLGMARAGRPFLMNVQTNAGHPASHGLATARPCASPGSTRPPWPGTCADTWVWRECLRRPDRRRGRAPRAPRVRDPDGIPSGHAQAGLRGAGRLAEAGNRTGGAQRPAALAPLWLARHRGRGDIQRSTRIGVGGLILAFRIGPMPGEVAEQSIRLFMQHVAPEFRSNAASSSASASARTRRSCIRRSRATSA